MSFESMDSIATELAEIIFNYMGVRNLKLPEDVFILISNDANHYGEDLNNYPYDFDEIAHKIATNEDKRISSGFNGELSFEVISDFSNELWPERNTKEVYPLWCGRYPILTGLLTAKHLTELSGKGSNGKLFSYSDTYSEKVLSFRETKMGLTAPFSLKDWVGFFAAGFYLQ